MTELIKRKKTSQYTIIFWLIIVFFIDPGGFLDIYFGSQFERLITAYGFVIIAYWCYFQNRKIHYVPIFEVHFLRKYIFVIIIWYSYYILWHYMINNNYYSGFLSVFFQNARMFSQGLIVIPLVYFSIISLNYFIKLTTKVTIIVLLLLFISIASPFSIIKFVSFDRGFVESARYFMYGNGLIYFSLTLTICMIALNYFKSKAILLSGLLVIIYILLTLTRRSLIGIFEHIVILSVLISFINHQFVFSRLKTFITTRYLVFYAIVLGLMIIISENILYTLQTFMVETYNSINLTESNTANSDVRMSLTKNVAIIRAIEDNFWGGTGFDPAWGTGDGGGKGYEGSDYIFMANFAQYGIIGLIIFLPFYILVISIIRNGLVNIKRNINMINNNKLEFFPYILVFLAASSEFIKNMIEYPNWYYPIGFLGGTQQYYIYFGLLLGSSVAIKHKIISIHK
ncbi:MAG: hypothetical protein P8I80_02990 [Bacteroidales bacterium]|nr:hypothetical protein [Bacteroidales bacterium]